jgi:uncharacterized protein YjiS (DUF1127 family)
VRPYYFDFAQQESPHPRAVAMARPIADHRLPASQPGGLIDALRAAVALIQLWHRRARERQQLACLDHRMLRDIGVTPAEAARECDKPFWRA